MTGRLVSFVATGPVFTWKRKNIYLVPNYGVGTSASSLSWCVAVLCDCVYSEVFEKNYCSSFTIYRFVWLVKFISPLACECDLTCCCASSVVANEMIPCWQLALVYRHPGQHQSRAIHRFSIVLWKKRMPWRNAFRKFISHSSESRSAGWMTSKALLVSMPNKLAVFKDRRDWIVHKLSGYQGCWLATSLENVHG